MTWLIAVPIAAVAAVVTYKIIRAHTAPVYGNDEPDDDEEDGDA